MSPVRCLLPVGVALLFLLAPAPGAPSAQPAEEEEAEDPEDPALGDRLETLESSLERMRRERRRLEEELAELERKGEREREALRDRLDRALAREREARRELQARMEELERFRADAAASHDYLTERIKEVQVGYPTRTLEEKPDEVTLGGAVWLNYAYRSFSEQDSQRGGDLSFDLFRLTVDGSLQDLLVSAQYRFYTFMQAVHHAWVGYAPSADWQLRFGVTQVPFGLLPYASHSYWFGLPFYLGLEDDYDLGLRAIYDREPWNVQVAAFKNAEPSIGPAPDRYSFDPVAVEGDPRGAEESNQVNARVTYLQRIGSLALEAGASVQWGQLFGGGGAESGDHWAAAGHLNAFLGPWNAQLEYVHYALRPPERAGMPGNLILLGAFGATRPVAAEGDLVVANLARTVPIGWGDLRQLTCYEDASALLKKPAAFETSWLSTTGCMVQAGPTYTYVDFIAGENATFLGDSAAASGLGPGAGGEAELRFNVSFEYFF